MEIRHGSGDANSNASCGPKKKLTIRNYLGYATGDAANNLAFSMAFLTGLTALSTLGAYYALYVLKDAQYIAWNTVAQTIGTFLIASFIPTIVMRMGKWIHCAGRGRCNCRSPSCVRPALHPNHRCVCLLPHGHRHGRCQHADVGTRSRHCGVWRVEDSRPYRGHDICPVLVYQEDGSGAGRRCRGLRPRLVAFNSKAAKAGQAQAQSTVDGIQFWTGAITAGFIVLSVIIMFFYPLTDKVFREIVGEIASRRAAREGTEVVKPPLE